jgi:hypothetical protein
MTDRPIPLGGWMRSLAATGSHPLAAALLAAFLMSAAVASEPRAGSGSAYGAERAAPLRGSNGGGSAADVVGIAAPPAPVPTGAARLTEMGKFFEHSEPPSQDYTKARELYCRAAADAHPEALQRLGWLYFKGHGVAVNEQVAGTLFRWAAELGDERSKGLSSALWSPIEAPPPCLVDRGLRTADALRERHQRVNQPAPPPGPPPPSAVVENPLQFRNTAPSIDQQRLVQLVVQSAREFRLDPRLVLAVMRMESNFDPMARSPKNAQGLMQLIPETALRFNVKDAFDPLDNMRGGMAYLRWLLAYYRGDVPLTLAAYNAGEGAVDRYRGVPPFPETIAYVQRIRMMYPFDRHPFDRGALAAGQGSWIDRDLAAGDLAGGNRTAAAR